MYIIDLLPAIILLGQEGEKSACEVVFDVSAWQTLYPTGADIVSDIPGVSDGLYLTYTLYGSETVYTELAAQLDLTGDALTWTPNAAILATDGEGSFVVHCLEGTIEKRSPLAKTIVNAGHGATGQVPTDARVLTTAGDLLTFSTLPARLPIGADGYFLKSNGTMPVWAAETAHNISRYVTAPVAGNSSGAVGDWSADANYIYACHATNTWIRCAKFAW